MRLQNCSVNSGEVVTLITVHCPSPKNFSKESYPIGVNVLNVYDVRLFANVDGLDDFVFLKYLKGILELLCVSKDIFRSQKGKKYVSKDIFCSRKENYLSAERQYPAYGADGAVGVPELFSVQITRRSNVANNHFGSTENLRTA